MTTPRPGSRFTYADALPTADDSVALLLAALATDHALELDDLAAAAGISRSAARRALPELTARGLLAEDPTDPGWYEYVLDNPQHDLVAAAAWRFSGISRPDEPSWGQEDKSEREHVQYRYRQWLPRPELVDEVATTTEPGDGPDLVTARDFGIWAAHTVHRLRSLEPDYQRAWRRSDNERFRDLIHQTGDLGGALTRARHIVNAASTADAQNGRDPYRVQLPASVWAQAMFLVSAEAADVLNLIELLEVAIAEGNHIHTHRDTALAELEIADVPSVGALARLEHLRLAQDAAVAARRRWSNPPRRYAGVGGLPRMRDVGTGLDQLVAVQLATSAETLTRQVAIMADHPSVSTYVETAAAEGLDLVTHVPAALTDSRHA